MTTSDTVRENTGMAEGTLDEAWREAEAALPEGWGFECGPAGDGTYWARAMADDMGCDCSACYGEGFYDPATDGRPTNAEGPTPAAALRALAVALQEANRV